MSISYNGDSKIYGVIFIDKDGTKHYLDQIVNGNTNKVIYCPDNVSISYGDLNYYSYTNSDNIGYDIIYASISITNNSLSNDVPASYIPYNTVTSDSIGNSTYLYSYLNSFFIASQTNTTIPANSNISIKCILAYRTFNFANNTYTDICGFTYPNITVNCSNESVQLSGIKYNTCNAVYNAKSKSVDIKYKNKEEIYITIKSETDTVSYSYSSGGGAGRPVTISTNSALPIKIKYYVLTNNSQSVEMHIESIDANNSISEVIAIGRGWGSRSSSGSESYNYYIDFSKIYGETFEYYAGESINKTIYLT